MVRRTAAALLVLGALVVLPAAAQVLYKWIDAEGKVQYSDRPPKDPSVPVTRIEPDVPATPAAAPPVRPKVAPPADEVVPPAPDRATQRRTLRGALELRLAQARQKLDDARRTLTETSSPEPDERQVVQQQMKSGNAGGGMHGLSLARSNCRPSVDKNGKAGVMCPASTPNEAYYDRMAKLEEAIRVAEEEVAQAEQAWRRGVD